MGIVTLLIEIAINSNFYRWEVNEQQRCRNIAWDWTDLAIRLEKNNNSFSVVVEYKIEKILQGDCLKSWLKQLLQQNNYQIRCS